MAKKPSIDGFVPRRSPTNIGGDYIRDQKLPNVDRRTGLEHRQVISRQADIPKGEEGLAPTQQHGLTRHDIDESLRDIDVQSEDQKNASRHKNRKQHKSNHSNRRKLIKRLIIVLFIVVLAGGLFVAFKAIIASNSIFKGDIFGLVQHKKLQQDENGRTNILILGTSEDDPGHQGAYLTDSIMILSLNQEKKDAYMISVPRDLEVKYGMACNSGYAGKINEYFNCVNQDYDSSKAEDERQSKTREFIGEIYGIPLQYSAHVNYSVMRDVINAVGDITVDIKGSGGAPGVMDSNFDWKCKGGNQYASRATMQKICPPNGHFIDYPNGPATLDAEHALYLAQARGDIEPTYGLGNSNFDREQNQQKIMVAIRDKAMSTGTLTSISKVTKLIDAIGDNLRTNFETSEIRTLMDIVKDIPSESIKRVNLLDSDIMNGNAQPVRGKYDFTELQAFVRKTLYSSGISNESAHVVVLNASGIEGAAQSEADKLSSLGMVVHETGNAPEDKAYPGNVIYKLTAQESDMPATTKKLSSIYGVSPKYVKSVPGVSVGEGVKFVIIVQEPSSFSIEQDDTTN